MHRTSAILVDVDDRFEQVDWHTTDGAVGVARVPPIVAGDARQQCQSFAATKRQV